MTLDSAAKWSRTHCFVRSLLDEEGNRLLVEVERHVLLRKTAAQERKLKIKYDFHVLGVKLAEYDRFVKTVQQLWTECALCLAEELFLQRFV